MNRSTRSADYQRVPRPIAVLAGEYEAGRSAPKHAHERAQLIYASAGIMSVVTEQRGYVIPPQRAVWIPSGVQHEVFYRTSVSLRTLYVAPDARPTLPSHCSVFAVPNLLRALISEAAHIPIEYQRNGREGLIMELILDEIAALPEARLQAPMPSSPRLKRICTQILNDPGRDDLIDNLAAETGCSRRTFTRLFRKETGMSFSAWRQHVRLIEATSRLATGQSVARAAYEVGYNSQSAFSATFHRAFGTAPSEYLAHRYAEPPAPARRLLPRDRVSLAIVR